MLSYGQGTKVQVLHIKEVHNHVALLAEVRKVLNLSVFNNYITLYIYVSHEDDELKITSNWCIIMVEFSSLSDSCVLKAVHM
ncbi:hypothetical protein CFP56_039766 [Quercus suber]|uniref:Uncharacterized protein n=1 Tax=Quercus suber TaxID=58331 RepID=A0AAW0MBR5_QUESU